MFGNVKVNYNPCKSKVAVERTAHYILGKLPQQIKDGVIKTAPNLYWGINCDRDNFPRDVMMTRKLFGKRNSGNANLSYQISISFSPDDRDKLTNEEVFRIAKDFAEKFFQGYEVLFAVHIDKPHPHAHFLIGNCHTVTGKAFRRNERDLYNMCEYLGEQCQQSGLIHSMRKDYYNHDLDGSPDKETFAEKQMKAKGKETFKDELREVIRIECGDPNNRTLEDVVNALMKHYHVECRVKGNTISYRHPEYTDKNGKLVSVRGSKLGDKYTVKGIEHELEKTRRGRTDRDLTGTAVITENRRESDNIGEDRLAGGKKETSRADSRPASRTQTAVRNIEDAAALTAGTQERGKSILYEGTDAQRCGEGTQRIQSGSQITATGGHGNGGSGNAGAGDHHSGVGRDRSLGEGRSSGLVGGHGECQEQPEGNDHGNLGDKDVPTLTELFRDYEKRNGKNRRKRAAKPQPARTVRKKPKGIDR